MAIDRLVEFQLFDPHLHGPYSAIEYAVITIRNIVLNITRIEHGFEMLGQ